MTKEEEAFKEGFKMYGKQVHFTMYMVYIYYKMPHAVSFYASRPE